MGRTPDFESANLGSSPSPAANAACERAKFVQIVAVKTAGPGEALYALAEDGSVWRHDYEIIGGHCFWMRVPDEDRRG